MNKHLGQMLAMQIIRLGDLPPNQPAIPKRAPVDGKNMSTVANVTRRDARSCLRLAGVTSFNPLLDT